MIKIVFFFEVQIVRREGYYYYGIPIIIKDMLVARRYDPRE